MSAYDQLVDDLWSIYFTAARELTYVAPGGEQRAYWAKRYCVELEQAVGSTGAVGFAERLVRRGGEASWDFERLRKAGRLDLTVEALVADSVKSYHGLFSREVVRMARERLNAAGYPVQVEDVAPPVAVERRPISGRPRLVVPRWIQLVALPLLVLGLWAVARAAGPVLLIFAVAGILALILDPVVRLIQRARVPRGLAVGIVYVGFWAAVATGAVLLVDPIGDQIEAFSANVPEYVQSSEAALERLQRWLDERGIDLQITSGAQDALSELERDVLAKFEDAVGFTRDLVELVIAALFTLVLIIVISVYMLLYARPIGDLARRVMPPSDGTSHDDFPSRVVRSVAGYVRGQLLFSAIMGTSAAIALWLFGTIGIFEEGRTYALFFGVFYGLMELIPYVGPVLGATPPVLIALVQDPLTAIWLVLLFVALQQLEGHVVAPLVFGHTLRINPLLVIFALLFGAHLYGIIGALVALPLAAMLRETIVYLREHLRLEPWPVAAGDGLTGLLAGEPNPPCPGCGQRMPAGDRYCRDCGQPLDASAPAAPVVARASRERHDQADDGNDDSGDDERANHPGRLPPER